MNLINHANIVPCLGAYFPKTETEEDSPEKEKEKRAGKEREKEKKVGKEREKEKRGEQRKEREVEREGRSILSSPPPGLLAQAHYYLTPLYTTTLFGLRFNIFTMPKDIDIAVQVTKYTILYH
tara:strand:+ start:1159 stop:1527 length:369 start_codon:yes stop_codon:yes gene_type:complete